MNIQKKHTTLLITLTICMQVGSAHGMEENELRRRLVGNRDQIDLELNQNNNMAGLHVAADVERLQRREEIESFIRKRKVCNILCGATILGLTYLNWKNSNNNQDGITIRKAYGIGNSFLCSVMHCKQDLPEVDWQYTFDVTLPFMLNDGIRVFERIAGLQSINNLYKVQQALDNQQVTEDIQNRADNEYDEHSKCAGVMTALSCLGNIFYMTKYPYTLGIWGINAAIHALNASNWIENIHACEELKELEEQIQEVDDHEHNDNDDVNGDNVDDAALNDRNFQFMPAFA